MIRRMIKPSKKLSFFLFGARGVGKSTWLQNEFVRDEHLWIDLTDPQVERRYSRKPEILLSEWNELKSRSNASQTSGIWVVIDEVQKIPSILDAVHIGIQRHKIKFALTWSSARKLKSTDRPESLNLNDFQKLANDAKADSWVLCRTMRVSTVGPTKIYPWKEGLDELFL